MLEAVWDWDSCRAPDRRWVPKRMTRSCKPTKPSRSVSCLSPWACSFLTLTALPICRANVLAIPFVLVKDVVNFPELSVSQIKMWAEEALEGVWSPEEDEVVIYSETIWITTGREEVLGTGRGSGSVGRQRPDLQKAWVLSPVFRKKEKKIECNIWWVASYWQRYLQHDFGQIGEVCGAWVSPSVSGVYEENEI